jgi:putative endopeptidase
VGQQFDAFTPLDSVHVNGKLTMGETWPTSAGSPLPTRRFSARAKDQKKIDGFTPMACFFLAYGQIY